MTAMERARNWLASEEYVPAEGQGHLTPEEARLVAALADVIFDAQLEVVGLAEDRLRTTLRDLRRSVTP